MPVPDPQTAEAVRVALERLQGWPDIARSPQLSGLLGYIVARTLAGEADAIKAYAIAVDVFRRPADFDPQADPIVRVQARRLRGLLDAYYRGPGRDEPVQITLPVGRYVPEFTPRRVAVAPPPVDTRKARVRKVIPLVLLMLVLAGAGLVAFAMLLGVRVSPWRPAAPDPLAPPSVTIVEFQNLTGDSNKQSLVAGLAVELVTDLELFGEMTVRYGGGATEQAGGAEGAGGDFVLTGIARETGSRVQYSAILTETASQSVVWSHQIEREGGTGSAPGEIDALSRDLSLLLGSARGPIHAATHDRIAAGADLGEERSLYVCLIMFHFYRDGGYATGAGAVDDCFAALPDEEQQLPMAAAAMGRLVAEGASQGAPAPDRLAAGEALISRALETGAVNSFVWEQRARVYELRGLNELARLAYSSALQLNPANADAMAALALVLALTGDTETAGQMGETALTKTPQPPPDWYYGGPALTDFRTANFASAAEHAASFARADRELGSVLAVLAAQNAGDGDMVNRFLPQVLDLASFRAHGIVPQLRKRIDDGVLMADIRKGLIEAGVPSAALDSAY